MTYLLVVLEPADATPTVALRLQDSPTRIAHAGTTFHEVPPDDEGGLFLGFYDWLRSRQGSVVGVQLTFHDGRDAVRAALGEARVGTWLTGYVFRVLFGDHADIDEESSVDQEFSVSRCYVDSAKRVALLFDASELNEDDMQALTAR